MLTIEPIKCLILYTFYVQPELIIASFFLIVQFSLSHWLILSPPPKISGKYSAAFHVNRATRFSTNNIYIFLIYLYTFLYCFLEIIYIYLPTPFPPLLPGNSLYFSCIGSPYAFLFLVYSLILVDHIL